MIYQCCDSSRRAVLANQTVYNGIDYLEVSDCQTTLYLHFLHDLAPNQLTAENIVICGGERITGIQVVGVVNGATLSPPLVEMECASSSPPNGSNILVVTVSQPGDFSTYTLKLVANAAGPGSESTTPPALFDPIFSTVQFSFKVGCPQWFDCQTPTECPPQTSPVPKFSYLAKDFASFRSLMLDRMSTILPAWQERNPADLGIVLVELLAFVGDYLSYQQDAVATEAYLGTARLRTSVRRHVKLVDYALLDGCNPRTWIHFDVSADFVLNWRTWSNGPQQLLTQGSYPGPFLEIGSDTYNLAINENPQVFELMEDVSLHTLHNQMQLYTWGDEQCCLPAGATHAWLLGAYPDLAVGMVVIFVEAKGPDTGAPADADPTHRWPVRLSKVDVTADPIGNLFLTPPTADPLPITRIEWLPADALPFAVCVSSHVPSATPPDVSDVTVVLGNNALADCGRTILNEQLPAVPAVNPALVLTTSGGCDRCSSTVQCSPAVVTQPTIRYNPQLAKGPLTFADPYTTVDGTGALIPANSALNARDLSALMPAISLTDQNSADTWVVELDLLHSAGDAKNFVAETEDDGTTSLRFGDGTFGVQVVSGDVFYARYRVGGGTVGNVGNDVLSIIASDDPLAQGNITAVRNPLPATGGLDPQSLDSVRAAAPYAFKTQERAVTAADYGTMAKVVDPAIQQARGTFRWTGSWNTVFIAVEPQGTETISAATKQQIVSGMELYRMAGHDVAVDAPIYVSLEIAICFCLTPGYLAPDVQEAILLALSAGTNPDGSVGLFSQQNFTFGQTVYLSPIIAAVQQIAGVSSVTASTFQRQGQPATSGLTTGSIPMQSLEIARLANDPNYPEHGVLTVTVCGAC
jgi:hypothetical protein